MGNTQQPATAQPYAGQSLANGISAAGNTIGQKG